MIVDAHLDIAWNALAHGRRFDAPPQRGFLISRPALETAGVGLVFATIYCAPASRQGPADGFSYETSREANLMARAQLGYYESLGLPLVRDRAGLERHIKGWRPGRLAAVLLMEGADPIERPSQLDWWAEHGVRILGPAWGRTRYAGGTGEPGGLTKEGDELLRRMHEAGVVLDVSHLADRAVREALEQWSGPVMASHSNARALVPGDRQLTDETVAEIGSRGGMIGVSFHRRHLRADDRPARLDDVVRHIVHLARVAGGPGHIGLGTDLDGGFGAADAPFRRLRGLAELRSRLAGRFQRREIEGLMGRNWIEFLLRSLAVIKEGS